MPDFSLSMSLFRKSETETEIVSTAVRHEANTDRHTAPSGAILPVTAMVHTVRAAVRTNRICLGRTAISVFPILTPFIDVTAHIVNTQLVGRFCADTVSLTTAIAAISCHITNHIASTILISATLVAATGGIFPLRLRRQTEMLPRHLIQFEDKGLTIVP